MMLSHNVTQGPERAPNRSLFAALGLTQEEMNRPLPSAAWVLVKVLL